MQSYFIWKGIDCRSMGVRTSGPAPIVRPEERVQHIQIPGRSGDLTQIEGEDIYNSYIQTVTIQVDGWSNVRNVYSWLRGDGYVTFSGEPDRQQKARIIGAVTLNKKSRNLDIWVGEVQFYCQPLKELLIEDYLTISTSGAVIRNCGDVIAKPWMRVLASGTSFTVSISGDGIPTNTLTVADIEASKHYRIFSDSMEVWNNAHDTLLTYKSTGEFPLLGVGKNTITFTGISSIQFHKQERFL